MTSIKVPVSVLETNITENMTGLSSLTTAFWPPRISASLVPKLTKKPGYMPVINCVHQREDEYTHFEFANRFRVDQIRVNQNKTLGCWVPRIGMGLTVP